jgi:hypothetical protein
MMNEEELRIGNYVNIEDTILRIDLQELYYNSSIMTPIPLTEEWLLKLGFESMYSNYIVKAGDYYNSIKQDCGKWIYSYDESDAGCYELKEIKYVHELQNLYFALNDKEL